MAFKYGTTSPTAIKYNGTDLTVLKYGTTAVWGKPYTLTIDKDSYTTVTVNRTSSPNQHASTGALSSGSVVYHGDVLQIIATPSSGYKITTFTVNGGSFTSGNTITVSGSITVVGKSTVAATWKTVWTGSVTKSFSSLKQSAVNEAIEAPATLTPNVPTRIKCGINWCGAVPGSENDYWNEYEQPAVALTDLPLTIEGYLYADEKITITKVSNYGSGGSMKSYFDCTRVISYMYGQYTGAGQIRFYTIEQYV